MKYTIDLIKDNPCYGCKYAKRLNDRQIRGMFGNKFGCTRLGKIDGLKDAAVRAVGRNDLDEAQELMGEAKDMQDDFARKGYFDCSGSLAPACYEKEGEKEKKQ